MRFLLLLLALAACGPKTVSLDPAAAQAAAWAAQQAALRAQIRELWNYEDPGVSEAKFTQAAATAATPEDRDQLLTQKARAAGLLGRYEDAQKLLDGIENPEGVVKMRVLLERGRLIRSMGDAQSSLPYFHEAWELGRQLHDDALSVDAAHMSAIASDLDAAISWTEIGLDLARKSPDPDAGRWIGPLTNNLGWSYHDAGRFEDALRTWEECLAWHQANDTGQGERIARWTVARGMRSLGRFEEALEIQLQVLIDTKENREPTGLVHEELGELYLALGRESSATRHFQKAYDALKLDAYIKTKEPERLRRLKRLAGK
ncbi:MAG: tetratricopeptide repeat protein [Deltaproteobacteria bacterium]|nr:MAG: tetratricopeptide repeat protein [Deltaproteobacteria bacterium]